MWVQGVDRCELIWRCLELPCRLSDKGRFSIGLDPTCLAFAETKPIGKEAE